ncbi:hypothetical protein ACFC5Z_38160 [Streptomyces sp. NPDC056004]|uniref:hypothetical protein n=1 Tax=Streptomyces sp. NPDC056004 TaxID=3345677 RepID=UPI0035D9275E
MATLRVGSGKTTPGGGWQTYSTEGVYIDVDTTSAKFSGDPVYHASIYSTGGSQLWTHGAHAIYQVSATGFRVVGDGQSETAAGRMGEDPARARRLAGGALSVEH